MYATSVNKNPKANQVSSRTHNVYTGSPLVGFFIGDNQMKTLAWMSIPLSQGLYALVDREDYERISKHKWYANRDSNTFYAVRMINKNGKRQSQLMHREILNVPKGIATDHINHCGLDNRKQNLREATAAQNQQNQLLQGGVSKYKGVRWHKHSKKWEARIHFNGKCKSLGCFDNEDDAAKVYDKKARELFGEFAYTNFQELVV